MKAKAKRKKKILETATDLLGNKIKRGDIIVYPGRIGHAAWMRTGVVREIEAYEDWYPCLKIIKKDMTKTYIKNTHKTVVINKAMINKEEFKCLMDISRKILGGEI